MEDISSEFNTSRPKTTTTDGIVRPNIKRRTRDIHNKSYKSVDDDSLKFLENLLDDPSDSKVVEPESLEGIGFNPEDFQPSEELESTFEPIQEPTSESVQESEPIKKCEDTESTFKPVENIDSTFEPIKENKFSIEPKVEPETKPETKVETKPELETKPKVETKVEPELETKPETKPKVETKVEPEPKVETKVETKVEPDSFQELEIVEDSPIEKIKPASPSYPFHRYRSPRDSTTIKINGEEIQRTTFSPIKIPEPECQVDSFIQDDSFVQENPIPHFPNPSRDNHVPVAIAPVISKEIIKHHSDNNNIPDYDSLSASEQARERARFISKFSTIQEAWPGRNAPEITTDMSLKEIHIQYREYVKNIRVREKSDQYRTYMVLGWQLVEIVCCYFGLDAGGYMIAQMQSFSKYSELLIKLGEKNYREEAEDKEDTEWGIMWQIAFVSGVNLITFVLIKMLAGVMGSHSVAQNIVEAVSSFITGAEMHPSTLFEGPSTQNAPSPANPFGGLDIASLISGLGGMFMNNNAQRPTVDLNNITENTFQPVYEG